jgi:hypothetical protein
MNPLHVISGYTKPISVFTAFTLVNGRTSGFFNTLDPQSGKTLPFLLPPVAAHCHRSPTDRQSGLSVQCPVRLFVHGTQNADVPAIRLNRECVTSLHFDPGPDRIIRYWEN